MSESAEGAPAAVGIFGGSGFYSFLEDVEELDFDTPYGRPSAPVALGEVAGTRVAFIPRHGRRHELPPHRIPYRANVWAMREAGVRRIIGPCASGALTRELGVGEFVVCDQYVDRTRGREDTFYDGPDTTHVSAADPFCPDLRRLLVGSEGTLAVVTDAWLGCSAPPPGYAWDAFGFPSFATSTWS